MSLSPPVKSRMSVQRLEEREVPAAGGWLTEAFQSGPAAGLPADWRQWANRPATSLFSVDRAGAGLGDQGRLVSNGISAAAGRAWVNTPFAADVETSASVYLSSLSPAEVFIRGQSPNTATPSYYAARVVRGTQVQLVRAVNGQTTVLGTVKSASWLSDQWVTVKVRAVGDRVSVFLYRGDTNQYLDPAGKWVRGAVAAVERTDTAVRGGGVVGVGRAAGYAGAVVIDSLRIGSPDDRADAPIREERFANGNTVTAPPGWSQWVSGGIVDVGTRTDETLRIASTSGGQARVWMTQPVPTDVQVSASLVVDSLAPAGVFARGSGVNGSKPTYYALTVTRGMVVELTRVVNGVSTVLGRLDTAGWQTGLWVQASLVVKGNQLRAQIYRSDTGQYLNANGTWGLAPAWALSRTDDAIRSGGLAGLSRGTGAAGELVFDNFIATPTPTSLTTAGPIPTERDKAAVVRPPVTDPSPTPTVPPVSPPTVPPVVPPVSPPTVPPAPASSSGLPAVPQRMSWIRVAQLAYSGTPLTAFEKGLLASSIDLVIPSLGYVNDIAAVTPNTPQLLYTNYSNIYGSLLTDWLAYADANRIDRESAFYHVNQAVPLQGLSASAIPVDQFWSISRGSDATRWSYVNRNPRPGTPPFDMAAAGESVVVAYPEKFREVSVSLNTPAGGNWRGVWQYVQAVDANGNPTRWGTLPLLSDTTGAFKRSGRFLFDPPADWVTATVNGTARMYQLRYVTTVGGTAPKVNTLRTTDYTNFNAATYTGTIPAFDRAADRNGDGYLSDAEYANRRRGYDARFAYQSRLTFPYYGPNRYATNPASAAFRGWAIDYSRRVLASLPTVSGFFVDNSTGLLDTDPSRLQESVAGYAENYGALVGAVNAALGSKWLLTNTAGGRTAVESQIRNGVSNMEEFALRPFYANTVQFEDLAATVAYRRQLNGGRAYQVLDSLPTAGIDATDPRFQLSALSMYYMVADPKLTFFMMNGGNEPATSWTRHWTDAIRYNVGQPRGAMTEFARGADPANRSLEYRVYQRAYQNALVLFKPVSYYRGVNGTIADTTATTHQLDRNYRQLRADGTLGPVVRTVTLRNGEGAILIPA